MVRLTQGKAEGSKMKKEETFLLQECYTQFACMYELHSDYFGENKLQLW